MNDNKLTWIYCIDCMKTEQAISPICSHCGEDCYNLGSDYAEIKTIPLEGFKSELVA